MFSPVWITEKWRPLRAVMRHYSRDRWRRCVLDVHSSRKGPSYWCVHEHSRSPCAIQSNPSCSHMGANLPPTAFLAQLTLPLVFHSSVTLAKIAFPPWPFCCVWTIKYGKKSSKSTNFTFWYKFSVKLSNNNLFQEAQCCVVFWKKNTFNIKGAFCNFFSLLKKPLWLHFRCTLKSYVDICVVQHLSKSGLYFELWDQKQHVRPSWNPTVQETKDFLTKIVHISCSFEWIFEHFVKYIVTFYSAVSKKTDPTLYYYCMWIKW